MNDDADIYLSQTDLGKVFDKTRVEIGRWLIEIGLRTPDKKPSRAAFAGSYVKKADTGRSLGGYFYIWHRDKTIKAR